VAAFARPVDGGTRRRCRLVRRARDRTELAFRRWRGYCACAHSCLGALAGLAGVAQVSQPMGLCNCSQVSDDDAGLAWHTARASVHGRRPTSERAGLTVLGAGTTYAIATNEDASRSKRRFRRAPESIVTESLRARRGSPCFGPASMDARGRGTRGRATPGHRCPGGDRWGQRR